MGRKSDKINKSKQQGKTNEKHNLSSNQLDLHRAVDKLLLLTTQAPNNNSIKELEAFLEISELLQLISKIEGKIVDNKHATDESARFSAATIAEFQNWLRENGAKFENISIHKFPGFDLGLKADKNIKEGSTMIIMPRNIMFSVENAQNSLLKKLIEKDALLKNMPNVTLAIYLLLEKYSAKSFWKPYFNILPIHYTTVLYFSKVELEELIGSPTLRTAILQIRNICRQYAYFFKLIWTSDDPACKALKKQFTFVDYCWAVSTIMTRQNTIPSSDQSTSVNALIPLWDLCNHTNGSITTNYNPTLERSECLAVRNFKAGEQLFIFYGTRTNAELFIHNGFVYDENEHDSYALSLGISQADSLKDKRTELLGKLSISSSTTFFLNNTSQPLNGSLLAFLRIFNMNDEQLSHWLESGKFEDLQCADCALDTVLEKKIWTFLQMRVKLLLSAYRTSLDQDRELLQKNQENDKGSSVSTHSLLAIRMRASEKRILNGVLDYAEQRIKQ